MYSEEYDEAGVLKLPARKNATVFTRVYHCYAPEAYRRSFYDSKSSVRGKEIVPKIFIKLRERSERFPYTRIARAAGDPSRYGVKNILFN
jgi:hypothetical protein